jgi:hypothetical protein
MALARTAFQADAPAYPALAACIGDGRRPSFGELRCVIRRLRLEIGQGEAIDPVRRRRISLAALAALGWSD